MLKYFTALVGIGAGLNMELGSPEVFAGIVLPLVALASLYVVLGAYPALLIAGGVWLIRQIDLNSTQMLPSAVYPALLMLDFIACVVWLAQRSIFMGGWRTPTADDD